jgi:energy-coupling factor transport system permease protein
MSEFDFLARLPMGQYLATGSALHRLDPRAKIASFLVLIMVLTFSQSLIGLGIGLAYLISLTFLSKINLKFALKSVITPLPFLLLFAVIQVFFYSSAKDPNILFSIWVFRITLTGIMAGAILLLRFTALILTLSLATFCISTSEGIQGVQRLLSPLNRLRIKTMDLVMVMQITLRFVPLLTQTAERIAKAQASRGADWGGKTKGLINRIKQLMPLVVPLFVISLRRAENLALAMDARAYGYLEYRTSMVEMKFTITDALGVLLNLIVSLIITYV